MPKQSVQTKGRRLICCRSDDEGFIVSFILTLCDFVLSLGHGSSKTTKG